MAFEKVTNADGRFSKGTTIGALDVSGKTEGEAKSLLEKEYVNWLKDSSIQLQYGEKTTALDLNQFHLDSQQTISSIKDGQKNSAFITIEQLQVEEQVEILFPEIKSSDLDINKLMNHLNETASLFDAGSHSFNLHDDYLLANKIKTDEIINTAVITLKDVPDNLQTIIEKNPSIDIAPDSTFSLLEFAKEHKINDADSLNIIATGIYQAILPSNFSIVEKNISNSLPEYAALGYEAMVSQSKNVDFVITNSNKSKYILVLQQENNQLSVTLKGQKFLYVYKITSKDEQMMKPKTIIQYSPQLLPGKTKVQTIGVDGLSVKIFRDVFQGEKFIKSELISEDYYPPVFQVELHGLTGSQQSPTPAAGTEIYEAGNSSSNQTTDNQTTPTTEAGQNNQIESDLWGKPNEQPK